MNSRLVWILLLSLAPSFAAAQTDEVAVDTDPPESRERMFVKLASQEETPTVKAILPIDGANVFFLNRDGKIGVAKFSPGLSQIGWDLYSDVTRKALPSLSLGPNYSVITASPWELTQAFDMDRNSELDFFQGLVRNWPGREKGVAITAGPIGDSTGRIFFALSPGTTPEDEAPKARLVAWHPPSKELVTVTESSLLIDAFAINRAGLLAARLQMADYKEGYFVSLTELPPFDPLEPGALPSPMPFTLPSLVIPAELTKGDQPAQPCFIREDGAEKLLLPCPVSRHLIEILPVKSGNSWQGSILLRAKCQKPIETLVEMAPGVILGGGAEGFFPLSGGSESYRIRRVSLAGDGIVLDFNRPVDRFEAVKADHYSVKAIALNGGQSNIDLKPVIESDGRTVVLKTKPLPPGNVLRVVCQNVPSEGGDSLLSNAVFYTIH